MADADTPPRPLPADWRAAFAALPGERPPADGWARLSAALPRPAAAPLSTVRHRRIARVALAVAASVLVALPAAWWLGTIPQLPQRATTAAPAGPAQRVPAGPAAGNDASAVSPPNVVATRGADRGIAAASTPDAAAATPSPARRPPTGDPAPTANGSRTAEPAAPHAARIAASRESVADPTTDTTPHAVQGAQVDDASLAALHAESARLEMLVAYARDDRMTSAPAAVLAAAVDDRIRLIDAALSQPVVDAAARASLWRERVAALQELAALEGTQRWMAVQGRSLDALARVD